ncbi:MAG: MFS transporter [Clostridia bacterium]|nr:MFS transporter [Clostridia bacterium]
MEAAAIRRVKYACYSTNLMMAVVGNLSPVLFLTFRSMYDLSFSLLGFLVLINFVTQLTVDLIFSFFSHRFNIPKVIKSIPVIAFFGFCLYALLPVLFPGSVYAGLCLGTVVFSAASGLAEVLISPVIAALPADDPDREMSKLHSVYAWGAVSVIIISTLFLLAAGHTRWPLLAMLFSLIPLASAILFAGSEIPRMETPEKVSGALGMMKDRGVWLCILAIFLGGASECTMAQWSSSYIERSLGIPKVFGDLFGVALFSVMLGTGRTLYAKIGRNIGRVLTFGSLGAVACYLVAAVSSVPAAGLVFCALTGLCTSMLWPGSLVVASDRYPKGGVFIYAIMAAGGDLGASVVPQLLGMIVDAAIASPDICAMAAGMNLSPEQLGMKLGMLFGMLFPLAGTFVFLYIWRRWRNSKPAA